MQRFIYFLRRRWAILLLGLLIVMVVLVLLFQATKPKGATYEFTISGIPASNNVGILDGSLYSYNGIMFSRTNLSNNQTTRLTGPIQLPDIDDITWGESGALLKISSFTQNSLMANLVNQNKLQAVPLANVVWYIDYASGTVKPLGSYVSQWSKAVYIPSSKEFVVYGGSLPSAKSVFSSTKDGKALSRINTTGDMEIVENIFNCQEGMCIIGRNSKKEVVLYSLNTNSGQAKQLKTITSGGMDPTSNTDFVLISENTDKAVRPKKNAQVTDLDEEEGISSVFNAKQSLYQISTEKEIAIGENTSDNLIAFIADGGTEVMTTGETDDKALTYYSGEIKEEKAPLEKKILKSSTVLANPLYFKEGLGIAKSGNSYILVTKDGSEANKTPLKNIPDLAKISSCTSSGSSTGDNRDLDLSVESTQLVGKVQNCLYDSSIDPYLYHVSFEILSVNRPVRF